MTLLEKLQKRSEPKNHVKAWFRQRGITQGAVAEQLGVCQQQISFLFTGRQVSEKLVEKYNLLARKLGAPEL